MVGISCLLFFTTHHPLLVPITKNMADVGQAWWSVVTVESFVAPMNVNNIIDYCGKKNSFAMFIIILNYTHNPMKAIYIEYKDLVGN